MLEVEFNTPLKLTFSQVDFDGEDDEEPVKNLKKSLLDGGAGKDSSDGFDGSLDKDKQSSTPLIIDGMEVDREVKNNDRSIT